VRLNANGKRLDAWLIYKCAQCDQTWNRPLLDRKPVSQIASADIDAMQRSTPVWVHAHEFDLADLRKHSAHIHHANEVRIEKHAPRLTRPDWSRIRLNLVPQSPTGHRVDKILCAGWGLSRNRLQKLLTSGALSAVSDAKTAFKRPLRTALTVDVDPSSLAPDMRYLLWKGLAEPDKR